MREVFAFTSAGKIRKVIGDFIAGLRIAVKIRKDSGDWAISGDFRTTDYQNL